MSILNELTNKTTKLAIVGLGYVGLPLAVEFGKIVPTIGKVSFEEGLKITVKWFNNNKVR